MAWSTPMTAISGAVFTASQYNTYIRDNLMATGVAQVSSAGDYIVATGTNAVTRRAIGRDFVSTTQSYNSGTYGDLSTPGPTVTVETGTTAIVMTAVAIDNSATDIAARASFEVSGATTLPADDVRAITRDGHAANCTIRWGATNVLTSLSPGTNTFTMKYAGATSEFSMRELIVVPF